MLCWLHSPLQVLFPHILASRTPYPDNITIHSKSEKVCGTAFCRIVGVAILAFRMYEYHPILPGSLDNITQSHPILTGSLHHHLLLLDLCHRHRSLPCHQINPKCSFCQVSGWASSQPWKDQQSNDESIKDLSGSGCATDLGGGNIFISASRLLQGVFKVESFPLFPC